MKHCTLLAVGALLVAALASGASAGVIAYEPFDYESGSLDGKGSASDDGFGGAWSDEAASDKHGGITVESGSLSYGSSGPAGGKASSNGTGVQRAASRDLDATYGTTGQDVWFSVLINHTGSNWRGADYHLIGLAQNGTWAGGFGTFRGEGDNSSDGYPVDTAIGGAFDNPTGTLVGGGINNVVDATYLLVAKATFSAADGEDRLDLWVNPGTTEPTTSDTTYASSATGNLSFNQIEVYTRNNNTDDVYVDEIRLGTDFAGVVPEPATMSLLALGGLGVLLRRRR